MTITWLWVWGGMPTLRRLEVFVEAATDCNFRKTADRLGISQAGISNHIMLLERELGYALFERRRGSTPRLTSAGAALLKQVQVTLDSARVFAPRKRGDDGRGEKIRFNVCVRNYLLHQAIIPAVQGFLDSNPGIELEFHPADDAAEIIDRITSGKSQIGLFRGNLQDIKAPLRAQSLGQSRSFLFASPALSERAKAENIAVSDLPFVLPQEGTQLCAAVERVLVRHRIIPTNIVARSQFPEVLSSWVVEGRGVSLLFMAQMQAQLAAGGVVTIGPPIGEWDAVMVTAPDQRDHRLGIVTEFFREILGQPLP